MELYFKNGNQANATLEHEHKINGLHLVESWIVEGEQDKVADVWPRCPGWNVDGLNEGRERRDMGEVR